jgi:hypothetical protein
MIPSFLVSVQDWMRIVATKVNPVLQGFPFMQLDSEPASPTEGFTFYDTTVHKVKTWDGSVWRAHW